MTSNQRLHRSFQWTLLTISALLVFELGFELTRDYPLEGGGVESQQSTDSTSRQPIEDRPTPPLSHYSEIVDRTLFSADREPFVPEEAVVETPTQPAQPRRRPEPKVNYALSGVIIVGTRKLALIETQPGNEIQRLSEGEELGNWTVAEVESTRVRLQRDGEERVLELTVKPANPRSSPQTSSSTNENNEETVTVGGRVEAVSADNDGESAVSDNVAGQSRAE